MNAEKLAMMANQIGTFFASQQGDAAEQIAAHIRQFWDPRMRREIKDYAKNNNNALAPTVKKAIDKL